MLPAYNPKLALAVLLCCLHIAHGGFPTMLEHPMQNFTALHGDHVFGVMRKYSDPMPAGRPFQSVGGS